jgi:hypothetical protein
MNIWISLRAEILKTKRTASWYFTILSAIAISTLFVITVAGGEFTAVNKVDPWTAIFMEEFKGLNLLILPFYVILMGALLPQIEYRNHTWKQVFVSPQKNMQIYTSKFILYQIFIVLFILVFLINAWICTLISNCIWPSMHLHEHAMDWEFILGYGARTYLSVFALSVLQFIIGMSQRHFITSIAIGLILWVTGTLLVFELHASFAQVFPYSFPVMVMFPKYAALFPKIEWVSFGVGSACLVGGLGLMPKIKRLS